MTKREAAVSSIFKLVKSNRLRSASCDGITFCRLRKILSVRPGVLRSQENLQRQVVKEMLLDWERKTPGRTESIFRSLQNVQPSQLADRNLFDFTSLKIDETAASRFVNVVNL